MEALTPAVLDYLTFVEALAVVVAVVTAISSADDVFVDVYYWCLRFLGGQNAKDRVLARSVSETTRLRERPFAIMVPAWQEHDVIYSMVATNSRLLTYKNHHYFIGVYQNDRLTFDEARRAKADCPNVHIVVVPRNGPTSKADCLNMILIGILDYEVDMGAHFAGIVLHDAEDFIHPHEIAVFNSLIGTSFDFVQLPVFSFKQSLRDVVGGIYMDEFAEVHTKDLLVRKHLSGLIPCAGVSACFSRDAVVALVKNNLGAMFQISSFTEDYDIAFRLRALGLRTTFASCPVNYTIDMHGESVTPTYLKRTLPISTREFFPSKLSSAYRQRARWLVGIVFQGTAAHGWGGTWGTMYFLLRDRKGILTGPTVILGYFVMVNFLLIEAYLVAYAPGVGFGLGLLSRDYVIDLFLLNLFFLAWRIAHRMLFTTMIYDWRHGLMSAPRLIVANFVNFFAAVRATQIYVAHRITGKALVWDKTAHSYPITMRDAVASGKNTRVKAAA
jgi:adsorption protein B